MTPVSMRSERSKGVQAAHPRDDDADDDGITFFSLFSFRFPPMLG
jgi:hypothetical protein